MTGVRICHSVGDNNRQEYANLPAYRENNETPETAQTKLTAELSTDRLKWMEVM